MPDRELDRTLTLAGTRPKTLRLRVVGKSLEQTTTAGKTGPKTTRKAYANEHEAAEAFRKAVRVKLRADYAYVTRTREPGSMIFEAYASGGGGGSVLDLSPDGTQIVTASMTAGPGFGTQLEVVDVATGARRIVTQEPANGGQAFLHAALFDRTAHGIYFLLRDDLEHVDLASGIRRTVARGQGFNPHVVRPSFDAARRRMVVFGEATTVRVLDERERVLLEVPTAAAKTECRGAALSPSGNLLAVYIVSRGIVYSHDDAKADTTNQVQIWDLESRKLWETVEVTTQITDVGITPGDDQLVLTRYYSQGPVWLAIPSGDERARMADPFRAGELARTRGWAYSADGKHLALVGYGLRVVDVASGKDVALEAATGIGDGSRVVFSADGKLVAAAIGGSALVYAL